MVRDSIEPIASPPVEGVLLDLLMAVMDSMSIWTAAVADRDRGLQWRDAVTARMIAAPRYMSYEELIAAAAAEMGFSRRSTSALLESWRTLTPWPDSSAISRVAVPYAFVTNCSRSLAETAAERSGLRPRFALSAEAAGLYKPDARIYRLACRKLGTPPGQTLFVAGSAYDAVGARDAGLQAMLVARRPDQRVPETVRVVGSLHEAVAAIDRQPQSFGAGTQ
jgi:2-haloalkanoic acid dehalogenase type II